MRFFGKVGFAETQQTALDVYEEVITEREYYGDVVKNARNIREDNEKVNFDLFVENSISILADDHANEHISAIRYVEWAGDRWIVANVTVERPRLLLRLGGVYNGPTV